MTEVKHDKGVVANKWTAEQRVSGEWVLVFDPTPGGEKNEDGVEGQRWLHWPILEVTDIVAEPEAVARKVAKLLNAADVFS